jgi:hypothetical protein
LDQAPQLLRDFVASSWSEPSPSTGFTTYGLLYWIVAYRYLDVGPRRLFQTLYNTPEKLAKRPWAPTLNWVIIVSMYVLTALAIYHQKVIYAAPPSDCNA